MLLKTSVKSSLIIFIFFVINILPLSAHENWIDFSDINTAEREGKITLKLSNGHTFPVSKQALGDRVINYFKAITPDGRVIPLKTKLEGNYRIAELKTKDEGTYLIISALKKPPRYFLKSIFTIGKKVEKDLRAGEKFEIVPSFPPSYLKIGDKLSFRVYFNDKPIQTSLSFSIDGKSNFFTSTNRKGEYVLKIRNKGRYLMTSSYKGKGCSLVFMIK